jgi:hypothetical protein
MPYGIEIGDWGRSTTTRAEVREPMPKKRQQRQPEAFPSKRISWGPSANPALTEAILAVVDQQLRDNTPPETQRTFERLVADGYAPEDARRLIGNVVTQEIFAVMQRGETYNEQRYIAALQGLPGSVV